VDDGTNSTSYTNAALADGDVVTCVLTSNATPCASGNPATSNTVTMTVRPGVPADMTITGVSPVCQSQTSVTYSVPFDASVTNYVWTFDAGLGVTPTSATNLRTITVDFSPISVTGNVTVKATNVCGDKTSSALSITVNPSLPVSVSIGASANPICAGTLVTFTAAPTNGGTTPAFQWKLNGSDVGTNSTTYTNAALSR
jgi:hypothetical protein